MQRYHVPMSRGRLLYLVAHYAVFAILVAVFLWLVPDKHENLWGSLFACAALLGAAYLMDQVFRRWRARISAAAQK